MQNERDYYKEALEIIEQGTAHYVPHIPRREHLVALYDRIIMAQTGAQLTMELVTRMKKVLAERREMLEKL
jgi:hypothetical protein